MVRSVSYKASGTYAQGVKTGETYYDVTLGKGDEIITTSNTFFATAEAMWIAGCKAVLVDCDEKTRCIDPESIRAAVGPKTKAIVPVHLYGQCAPMREIRKIAESFSHTN